VVRVLKLDMMSNIEMEALNDNINEMDHDGDETNDNDQNMKRARIDEEFLPEELRIYHEIQDLLASVCETNKRKKLVLDALYAALEDQKEST
jgi:hypothetical protein